MDKETSQTPADAEAALDALGLDALAGTALGIELGRLRGGEAWCTVTAAGLQFYDYGDWDEVLDRPVIPEPGDRLSLMRRPDNRVDSHAVEVWWRDGHQLGHVPRGVAAELAPRLDEGAACRAYVLQPGDGEAWSLRALLVGPAVGDLHGREIAGGLHRAVEDASGATWGAERVQADPYDAGPGREQRWCYAPRPAHPAPTERQRAAAAAWEGRRRTARATREAAATYAFHLLPEDRPSMPEGAGAAPDEALRGQTFPWWDAVPPWLTTKSRLASFGLRPRADAAPFAAIEYGSGRRHRRYALWAFADATPKRAVPAEAAARAAEAAFWRRPEIEARQAERDAAWAARQQSRWNAERADRDWSR